LKRQSTALFKKQQTIDSHRKHSELETFQKRLSSSKKIDEFCLFCHWQQSQSSLRLSAINANSKISCQLEDKKFELEIIHFPFKNDKINDYCDHVKEAVEDLLIKSDIHKIIHICLATEKFHDTHKLVDEIDSLINSTNKGLQQNQVLKSVGIDKVFLEEGDQAQLVYISTTDLPFEKSLDLQEAIVKTIKEKEASLKSKSSDDWLLINLTMFDRCAAQLTEIFSYDNFTSSFYKKIILLGPHQHLDDKKYSSYIFPKALDSARPFILMFCILPFIFFGGYLIYNGTSFYTQGFGWIFILLGLYTIYFQIKKKFQS
jgi:hypothetical protein